MSNKNHCARLWMEKVESSVTGVKNNCIPGVQFAFNSDLSICLRVGYAISCTQKILKVLPTSYLNIWVSCMQIL